jgi:hypothetical protein
MNLLTSNNVEAILRRDRSADWQAARNNERLSARKQLNGSAGAWKRAQFCRKYHAAEARARVAETQSVKIREIRRNYGCQSRSFQVS